MSEHTVPNAATEQEEEIEAHVSADPGPEPTPQEEALADSNSLDPAVARSEKEFNELGANVKGEGQLP